MNITYTQNGDYLIPNIVMPVRIGLSGLSHPHLRGNLCRADPERGDFRGCHQLHLEHPTSATSF